MKKKNYISTAKATYHDLITSSKFKLGFIKNMHNHKVIIQNLNSSRAFYVNTVYFLVFYQCDLTISISDTATQKFDFLNEYLYEILNKAKKIKNIKLNSNPFIKLKNEFKKNTLYYNSYLHGCESIIKEIAVTGLNPVFIPLPYNNYYLNLSFYNIQVNKLL
jgi:hypothetical protein